MAAYPIRRTQNKNKHASKFTTQYASVWSHQPKQTSSMPGKVSRTNYINPQPLQWTWFEIDEIEDNWNGSGKGGEAKWMPVLLKVANHLEYPTIQCNMWQKKASNTNALIPFYAHPMPSYISMPTQCPYAFLCPPNANFYYFYVNEISGSPTILRFLQTLRNIYVIVNVL